MSHLTRAVVVTFVASLALLPVAPARAADPEPAAGRAVYVGDELLKDYAPVPALVTKVTPVDKPRFLATDIHCHWNIDLDPAFLLRKMDELGVQRAVNLSGGFGESLDKMLAKFHAAAPDRLLIFANLDFSKIDAPDFSGQMATMLDRAKANGARGLKIFKNLGLTVKDASGKVVPVDDPRLDAVWAKCGEIGFPVLIHSADPMAFFQPTDQRNERWMQLKRHPSWSFADAEKFPPYDDVVAQHNRVVARHPGTTFISAHLINSGEDLARLGATLDKYPNLHVDLSGRVSEIGRQPYAARKFLLKYADRVLFGTDRYPGRPDQPRYKIYYRFLETDDEYFDYYDHPFPPEGEWRIYGVFLPDDALRKIYQTNADRVLGMSGATTRPATQP